MAVKYVPLAYRLIRDFFTFIINVFYSQIDVTGQNEIPEEGPIIFCGNHGNGLIDPAIIMGETKRMISPIAKAPLWKTPVLGTLLNALHAVPVYRKQDFGGATQNNTGAIDAMAQILSRNDCLVIFPEGISHDDPSIVELKTGFARAAVQALLSSNSDDFKVTIIPVGINYNEKSVFRSSVFLEFGHPIYITKRELVARIGGKGQKSEEEIENASHQYVTELTHNVHKMLLEITLQAPSWDTIRLLHLARDMYLERGNKLSKEEVIKITHRFAKGYKKAVQNKQIASLLDDLQTYKHQLDLLRVSDKHIEELTLKKRSIAWDVTRSVFFHLVCLPLALPGAIIHAPIGIASSWLGAYLSRNPEGGVYGDSLASYTIASAMVFVPLTYAGIAIATWKDFGASKIPLVIASVVLSGLFAARTRPLSFFGKAVSLTLKLILADFRTMKQRRKQLQSRVRDLINKYHEEIENEDNNKQ